MTTQFCKFVGTEGKEKGQRCVAFIHHIGDHDLMPRGSVTVQTIERQEEAERRLGGDVAVVVADELDRVVEAAPSTKTEVSESDGETESAPAPESSAETTATPMSPATSVETAADPVPVTTTTPSEPTPGESVE